MPLFQCRKLTRPVGEFMVCVFCGRPEEQFLSDFLFSNVTQHIRVNVQPDVTDVVVKFSGYDPNDLADRTFIVMLGQLFKKLTVHFTFLCKHGDEIQQYFLFF